ncbi:hypothetical protein QRO08_11535 [Paracidovorax citrulli]|nr:hypothetical protein [Paracidovorax citrulli]PVY67499.1 hypothetical protein C8E08_4945 [Paracidovorax citrulli]REG68341.1 hypothetical protein C8E07_1446 [Paracidovorax citrulli]RLJ92899.1 hypothetical protein C8E06_1447 [Paracidovorax citrulli]WIY31533.1 hypothetical protein QRO09_07415 [Paracidovorax citrulli]WIY40811.1 hypothetical protein QRO10_07690 [Paracidovorax citrulli]
MNMRLTKDRSGWTAITEFELGNAQVLLLRTCRNSASGRLNTTATVHEITGTRSLVHRMDFGTGGGDFSALVFASKPARCTESIVRIQHEQALQQLDAIKRDVCEHYARLEASAAKPDAPQPEQQLA